MTLIADAYVVNFDGIYVLGTFRYRSIYTHWLRSHVRSGICCAVRIDRALHCVSGCREDKFGGLITNLEVLGVLLGRGADPNVPADPPRTRDPAICEVQVGGFPM